MRVGTADNGRVVLFSRFNCVKQSMLKIKHTLYWPGEISKWLSPHVLQFFTEPSSTGQLMSWDLACTARVRDDSARPELLLIGNVVNLHPDGPTASHYRQTYSTCLSFTRKISIEVNAHSDNRIEPLAISLLERRGSVQHPLQDIPSITNHSAAVVDNPPSTSALHALSSCRYDRRASQRCTRLCCEQKFVYE